MPFPPPAPANENPAFVSAPSVVGSYWTWSQLQNYNRNYSGTNGVVFPPNFGRYSLFTSGPARSAVPPADYPSVGK